MSVRNFGAGLLAGITLALAVTSPLRAEDLEKQVWADYGAYYFANEFREYYVDGGFRFLTDSNAWKRAYVRPSMRIHRWGFLEPHFGLGLFYTAQNLLSDTVELRPFLGLKARWPHVGPFTFTHYGRLEYRGTWFTDDGSYSDAGRLRYKLSTRIPLKLAGGNATLDRLYIPLSLEAFVDVGDNVDVLFRSEGRFDAGLGYTASESWVAEFHVIGQQSRSGIENDFATEELIFRLQVKHLLRSHDYRFRREDLPD